METGRALKAILKDYVRVYEEQLILDEAAKIYKELALDGEVPLRGLAKALESEPKTVAKLFREYDRDDMGAIGAKQLLAITRKLNFMEGYCDGCYEPIGGDDGSFVCASCDFALCEECYPGRTKFHPEHDEFETSRERERREAASAEGLPIDTGRYLRWEVDDLFEEADTDEDGEISLGEFKAYYDKLEDCSEEAIEFALSCDFDGDGRISRREAAYLIVGENMVRSCNECNEMSFVTDGKLMSCVECVDDYDVCVPCYNAGQCTHAHERFEIVKPFQLRNIGLHYKHSHDDMWRVAVGDADLWETYQPFVGDKVATTVKLGAPTPVLRRATNSVPETNNSPSVIDTFGAAVVDGVRQGLEESAKEKVKEMILNPETDWGEVADNVKETAGVVFSWLSEL